MKKHSLLFALPLFLLPLFTGCGGTDYYGYVSEIKEDIFLARAEEFTLSLSCVSREYPYISDGIPSPSSKVVEISLTGETLASSYEVYVLGENPVGGEMTFRTYAGDYFFSVGVNEFYTSEVELRVERNGQSVEVVATSVKNEKTISPREALDRAVEAEKETIKSMTNNEGFEGEFYIRLLRRESNYYYVGIINRQGGVISLLIDSESGEILARRQND